MGDSTRGADSSYTGGPRVKRVKIEQTRIRTRGVARSSGPGQYYPETDLDDDGTTQRGEMLESESGYGDKSPSFNNPNVAPSQSTHHAPPEHGLSSSQSASESSPLVKSSLKNSNEANSEPFSASITPHVDFSTAPSDSTELAWWVAQQVTHFQNDISQPPVTESDEQLTISTKRSARRVNQRLTRDGERKQSPGRQKQRDDNRERKKRWRENNTLKNSDNDLRSRINKRAKAKFGDAPSSDKTAYCEAEFNKRRTKREAKQRIRAIEGGVFPNFTMAPDLRKQVFSPHDPSLTAEVHEAGTVLMKILFGSDSNHAEQNSTSPAMTLRAATEGRAHVYVEALGIMAKNAELVKGIVTNLDGVEGNDDVETLSGDDSGPQNLQSTQARSASASSHDSSANQQSAERIKSALAATALLIQMDQPKPYSSPYGNPPPKTAPPAMNGPTANTPTTNRTEPKIVQKRSDDGHGLDQSQIDALLALANGGSLTDDDDDDKTIADPDEMNGQQSESSGAPEADTKVHATVQKFISQLLESQKGEQPTNGQVTPSTAVPNTATKGFPSVEDQAATLQSLIAQAGVGVNTIIPAAQSHATSQLYAHLFSRARSSTPSTPAGTANGGTNGGANGGPNPIKANIPPNPALMQPKPPAFQPAFQPQPVYWNVVHVPHPSETSVVGLRVRPRDPELAAKIRAYGYPPLPNSRPGAQET